MLVRMSDWAWLSKKEYSLEKLPRLKSALTIQPKRTSKHQTDIDPIRLYEERDGQIGIPRAFFEERRKLDHDIKDDMSRGRAIDVEFAGKLKADQKGAIRALSREIEIGRSGGIIQATPGWGKTVVGISAWTMLGRTAIVIVQKEYLANQWKNRISTFAPSARVGIIQKDRCEYGDDYDISIATIQTLVKRRDEYPPEFWDAFGLVITDETHRIGAPSWCQTATMFTGFYRLGLTATPRRKDGAQNVFFWHIGPVIYVSKTKRLTPRLRRIFTRFTLVKTQSFDPTLASKEVQLRFLCANPDRNKLIVSELVKAVGAGRKVLVLSDRRKHLERLREMFGPAKPDGCTVDFYVGGRPQRELDVAEKADVVFACVTDDVECLTLDGWKHRSQLVEGEKIASYSMERGVIEYEPLERVCSYDFDGDLCHIDNKTLDVLMTWNHRNVVSSERVVGGRKERFEHIKEASELVARDKLRLTAPVDYPEVDGIGEKSAELIGWIIAEGTYKSNNGRGIVIYQNEGSCADRIENLLADSSLRYRRSEYRPGSFSWHIPEDDCGVIKGICPDKRLSKEIVSLPISECEALFDGLVDGDGHRRDDGRITFIQKDKDTVDWFCVLALRLGYRSVVGHCGQAYRVHLTRKTHIGLNDGRSKIVSAKYCGVIWCPVVGNGTWVARRNGSVFITGNTYQMAREALDIPDLDTLFLTTPVADVEQAVGRIMRESPDKKKPLVTDFIDKNVKGFVRLWNERRRFYISEGMFEEKK